MRFVWILTVALQVAKGQEHNNQYIPAKAEQHVIDIKNHNDNRSGCLIWNEKSQLRDDLAVWKRELHHYNEQLKKKYYFAPDLRTLLDDDENNREQVCREFADPPPAAATTHVQSSTYNMLLSEFSSSDPKTVELKKMKSMRGRNLDTRHGGTQSSRANLMKEYFHESQQLSYSSKQGYMEPLLPPLRHPDMCTPTVCTSKPCLPGSSRGNHVSDLDYLIEDFGHICRNVLHKKMRTVFVDMGALTYHVEETIQTIEKYRRFGIHFDHIYSYDNAANNNDDNTNVQDVYGNIPAHMRMPLHLINIPISAEEDHDGNPWTMLMENFEPDDFIVVKLDIDTRSVDMPLFRQLLENPKLQELVNVFYFEHRVQMDEMQSYWGQHSSGLTNGTITGSLEMFQSLRKAGVAAHYWI